MLRAVAVRAGLLAGGVFSVVVPAVRGTITVDQVIGYDPGTVIDSYWGAPYTQQSAVLGLPDTTQNVPNLYDGGGNQIAWADSSAITPFNAQYSPSGVLAISNQGGSLTVHLSASILIGQGAAIGLHAASGLADASYPNGQNSDPAGTYTDSRQADIQVSADNVHWVDLGDQAFDSPTNIYKDATDPYGGTPGTQLADFSKPFYGGLAAFNGANWSQTLAALNGSAGGTWLDLSNLPLSQVNYVKLSTSLGETMYVDSIVGDSAVPEPAEIGAVLLPLMLLRRRK